MRDDAGVVNRKDAERLQPIVFDALRRERRRPAHLSNLAASLERSDPLPPTQIPPNLVTMNSIVRIRNVETGEKSVFQLVFPVKADVEHRCISVLAPLGAALFGREEGEQFEVLLPSDRTRRFEVEKILYQPEAAGDLDR